MRKIAFAVFASAVLATPPARAQFGGVVYDPTQSVHAVAQLGNEYKSLQFQAIEVSEQQEGNATRLQMLSTDIKTAATALQIYNTAYQQLNMYKSMMLAPSSLYKRFESPMGDFYMLTQAANHYSPGANKLPYISATSTGTGAANSLQMISLPSTAIIPYSSVGVAGQQQLSAQGATVDINDSIEVTNLQAIGTIRANQQARLADIQNLEIATANQDPSATTQMAVLMRINQALLLQLRSQQDANQVATNASLQQLMDAKEHQDTMKAAFRDSSNYQTFYQNTVSTTSSGAAKLLTNSTY